MLGFFFYFPQRQQREERHREKLENAVGSCEFSFIAVRGVDDMIENILAHALQKMVKYSLLHVI